MCESQTYTVNEVSHKLLTIFQNVNEWLTFAEAKNGVLLAFAGTGFTTTITILDTGTTLPKSLQIGLLLATLLLCVCAFICALSFLPKTNLDRFFKRKKQTSCNSRNGLGNNLYYFGHLQKYFYEQLLVEFDQYYFDNQLTKPYKKEWKDITVQIIINAEITAIKFELFTIALYFLLAGILAIPLSMLVSLIICQSL